MTFRKLLTLLCIVMFVVLLSACGKQAAEGPKATQPTTELSSTPTEPEKDLEEGELPAVTVPEQTQPLTEPTEKVEITEATEPTEGTQPSKPKPSNPPKETKPPEVSEPSQPTQPTETTPTEPTQSSEPVETTPPEITEPTEPPRLDEDELPPIPVF